MLGVSNYSTYDSQKIVPFLEVLEGLNATLVKAHSTAQTLNCILNSTSSEKR